MPAELPVRANFASSSPGGPAIPRQIDFIVRVPGGGRPDGAVQRAGGTCPCALARITGLEISCHPILPNSGHYGFAP